MGVKRSNLYALNKLMEVWCPKIEPKLQAKLNRNQINHQQTGIFEDLYFIFDGYSKFLQFWLNLSAKT
jgi:hypothetical protein